MMADERSPMHKDFPAWSANLVLGTDDEWERARWATVDILAKDADSQTVEALVRLAFGSRHAPVKVSLDKIYQAFLDSDSAFDPKKAARELEVFAGACLQVLFDRGGTMGARAALRVLTTSFLGARVPKLPINLVALAETAVAQIAEERRARPKLTIDASGNFGIVAAIEKLQGEDNTDNAAAALTALYKGYQHVLRQQNDSIRSIDRFLQAQAEELDMLWWLTGGRSLDLDIGFGSVGADAQPLLFSRELADRTTSLPGPVSIKAILLRAGIGERKKLTVPAAVIAMDTAWLSEAAAEEASSVTMPLHFAISRQLESGKGDAWVQGWSAVVDVESERRVGAADLAIQFYRESLLALFG
jgi:hypothetical protein